MLNNKVLFFLCYSANIGTNPESIVIKYVNFEFINPKSLSLYQNDNLMKESDNKDVSNRAYRLLVPYSNTVDMAKKILLFYNGYLMASGNEKNVIDARHLNLLAYYFVFGYSYETKKKFSHCFSTDLQYVSVLDTEMKKRGILIDREGNYRTRCLCPDIENMRRLFVLEGSRDQCALVSLFYRKKTFEADGEE